MSTITKDNASEYMKKLRDVFSYCSYQQPILARMGFYVKRHIISTPGFLAAASRNSIMVGDKFFERSRSDQAYILIHEILHVALQHALRFPKIKKYSQEEKNVAADLIINFSLDHIKNKKGDPVFPRPDIGLFKDKVLPNISDEDFCKLTISDICELLREKNKKNSNSKDSKKDGNEESSQPGDGGSEEPGELGSSIHIDVSVSPEDHPDTVATDNPGNSDSPDQSESEAMGNWEHRTKDAFSKIGSNFASTMITSNLPTVNTDWRALTSSHIAKSVRANKGKKKTYRRPHRRYLSGASTFYQPGKIKKEGPSAIAAFVDVSGSCYSEEILAEFLANLINIQKQLGCILYVISFDTKITSIQIAEDLASTYQTFNWKGGGGTDFRPIFDDVLTADDHEGEVLASDICAYVIMTDLEGSTPMKAPSKTVVWAGLESDRNFKSKVPFGVPVIMS